MKFFIVLAALISVACASGLIGHGAIVSGPVAVTTGYGLGTRFFFARFSGSGLTLCANRYSSNLNRRLRTG